MIENITILGKSISLYYTFWFISLIVALVVGSKLGKIYGFSWARSTIFVVLDVLLAYLLIWVISWIFGGGRLIGFNFARIVWCAPIYFVLISILFKEPLWKLADFFAPIGGIVAGISHIGCIFSGCCHGYPSSWGIYSNTAETVCFPIQPIEGVTNILISVVLLIMARRQMQQKRLYLWYMILFGATRFIFEFFRDNEKMWHGISDLAFHALAATILGLIGLFLFRRFNKENPVYEENKT